MWACFFVLDHCLVALPNYASAHGQLTGRSL
uniref:Uncharacterized protein n=1 Tax=Anguilla anguilla TaxID=7936 RepID=A0A0E9PCC6_ANGAN